VREREWVRESEIAGEGKRERERDLFSANEKKVIGEGVEVHAASTS